MKIFFVGIHNKEGMKPLDSKTMSGKMIDAVIKELTTVDACVKTNLCECEYQPNDTDEIINWNTLWHEKYNATSSDVIVLLGAWTHKNFLKPTDATIVKIPHPASCMGNVKKKEYIVNALNKIYLFK